MGSNQFPHQTELYQPRHHLSGWLWLFLLIELTVFVLSAMFYANHEAILGVDQSSAAATYIDLVYLSTITQTTIGFGDITPSAPNTKLVISLCGLIGHFYTVVLVGILISKFTSNSTHQNYLKK